MSGRLIRERVLIFAPPLWYDVLILMCILGGFGSAILALTDHLPGPASSLLGDDYWKIFGTLFGLAGAWAAVSNERLSIDIRKGTYARLEGQGFLKRITRGTVAEFHVIALMTSMEPSGLTYRLVLYWKGGRQPIFILSQQKGPFMAQVGGMINAGAGKINYYGQSWSRILNVPYMDISGQLSPGPLPIV